MGAAEAIEDEDAESALEMHKVLDEIIDLVPDGIKLEAMDKSDFRLKVREKIQELEASTRHEREIRTKEAIEKS